MPALRPYQTDGAHWLAGRKAGLLADVMGLGKTAQAVRAAQWSGARPEEILVVCPASVTGVWRAEFTRWWGPDKDPIVVSYDMLARRPADYAGHWRVLILDEVHYCKNPKAKRTKAVFGKDGVATRADHVWCLSGTPAPNNPSEIWPMLHALAPEMIARQDGKPMNHWSFTNRYCVVRNNGFGMQIVRGQRQDELKRRIAPFVLRRTKGDVARDLPPLTFGELPFDAKQALTFIRQQLAKEGADTHQEKAIEEALAIKGAEGLASIAQEMASLRRITALAKVPLLAAWAKTWLESCDEKLVLFGMHRDPLDALVRELAQFSPSLIHGGTPTRQRPEQVARFQEDPKTRVFIGQIHAAGTGLTLTAASTLVFLEQSWTPSDNLQAAMRIHRIGQKNACMVHSAVLAGSVDEAVGRTLARKTEDLVRLGLLEVSG